MSETPFVIYILPSSGASFPYQLGILTAMSNARKYLNQPPIRNAPDAVIACSGGNLSAYLAMASDWDRERIISNTFFIDTESFVSHWATYLPSWLFIPFSRSFYRQGYGFEKLLRRFFSTSAKIKEGTEIWTGTVHHGDNNFREQVVFTNKEKKSTFLEPRISSNGIFPNLGNTKTPFYLNGDIEDISKVIQASASIPWVVKPCIIKGNKYSDGGSLFCSPLSLFDESIKKLSISDNRKLRMYYISPNNIDNPAKAFIDAFDSITDLICGSSYSDLKIFINIITSLGNNNSTVFEPTHHDDLSTSEKLGNLIFDLETNYKHFGVIFYPNVDYQTVVIGNKINHLEIVKGILNSETTLKAYVWKIP